MTDGAIDSTERNILKQQQLSAITDDVTLKLKQDVNSASVLSSDDELDAKEVAHKRDVKALHSRASSIYFQSKMPCWFSMQMQLVEISMIEELFVLNCHLSIFFKDNKHNDFEKLFDKNCLSLMQQNGNVTFDELNMNVRKKLPFKGSFILNCADIDIKRCHLEQYDKDKKVWQQYINFNASCAENLELSDFPFDSQFLNIQMVYSYSDYRFLSKCPDWILDDPQGKYKLFDSDVAIKLTVKDSINTQYKVYAPWIDFGSHRFGLIRLRVRREPSFYLFNGILPLFLVICCSFASFVMPVDQYLGDKLAYIITLLLTTAAYQYALNSDLPKTPEATMIDNYILYAYGVLTFFVLEISLSSMAYEAGYEDGAEIFDYVTTSIFALVWLYKSGKFVHGYYVFKTRDVDWNKLSEIDSDGWNKQSSGFILVEEGKHVGSSND
eukprot:548232_1